MVEKQTQCNKDTNCIEINLNNQLLSHIVNDFHGKDGSESNWFSLRETVSH